MVIQYQVINIKQRTKFWQQKSLVSPPRTVMGARVVARFKHGYSQSQLDIALKAAACPTSLSQCNWSVIQLGELGLLKKSSQMVIKVQPGF